jgi:aryl-alcohol dehydrogenase-like predicted oxidoreductase
MRYHSLGSSGLTVSEVSFGCMSLGDDHAANARLLHQAVDAGVNLFDTADLYQHGQNETTVGRALAGVRSRVVIATKVGNQWRPDGSGWDWNPRKAYILQAAEQSLRRLGTDCIDLYQLHGGTLDDPIDETIEAFETLKQQGKIRHYGISSIRPNVIREYVKRSRIVSVMMQYSLLDRRPEEESLGLLRENGIGVLVRGGLAKGLLVGKTPEEYLGLTADEVARAAQAVAKVAQENGRTPVETALRFALHHSAVTTAVVGVRTEEQLAQCLVAKDAAPLTDDEYGTLAKSVRQLRYQEHR